MKAALNQFWQERDERERKMLKVLAPAIALTLAYLLVARPIAQYLDDANRNLNAAEREYAMVEDAVARTTAARNAAPEIPIASTKEFPDRVRRSALEASLSLARTEIGPASVSVWIDSAEPVVLFTWLDDIEHMHGIYVDGATISTIEGGTKLRVQLTLKYREQ